MRDRESYEGAGARLVEIHTPSAPRWLLVGCALLSVSLMGATCWRWSRVETLTLSMEQAVTALRSGDDSSAAVFAHAKRGVAMLRELATRQDDTGARARVFLQRLREEIDK